MRAGLWPSERVWNSRFVLTERHYPSRRAVGVPILVLSPYNATMRFFNTAGPVNPQKHYCLPPLARLNVEELLGLIRQEKYFVLHAPRQTGKTSALR